MNSLLKEFESRNSQVLAVSLDSVHTNKQYAESMGGLDYPILSDWNPHGKWAREFGVWLEEPGCASRSTLILDAQGVIRDIHTNPIGEDRDFKTTLTRLDEINKAVRA